MRSFEREPPADALTTKGFEMTDEAVSPAHFLLCSDCFVDEGLRIDAWKHGAEHQGECPNCNGSDEVNQ